MCKQGLRLLPGQASLLLLRCLRIAYLFLRLWHLT